ncbi:MAG: ABC transporter permease [Candidatus Brocadiia bacterium]
MSLKLKDRVDGWANPLLIREMYQSLHSKKFLAALWLLLLVSLMTYVLAYLGSGSGGECGDDMFVVFSVCMAIVGVVVIPYLAFSNLYEEIKSGTIELVQITRLHAKRHVRGRLLAAVVKTGLLVALMGPFAVAAFLFHGIGVGQILATLAVISVVSLFAVSVAIFFAALTSLRYFRTLGRLIHILLQVGAVLMIVQMGVGAGYLFRDIAGELNHIVIFVAILGLMSLLWSLFLCACSANILTFEANKSSVAPKCWLLLIIVISQGVGLGIMAAQGGYSDETALFFVVTTLIPLTICATVWMLDKQGTSARQDLEIEKSGRTYSFLLFPFTDGPGAGGVYFTLACGLILLELWSGAALLLLRSFEFLPIFALTWVFWVYGGYLAYQARAIGALIPQKWRNTSGRRIVLLVCIVAHLAAGLIFIVLFESGMGHFSFEADNPILGAFPVAYAVEVTDYAEPLDVFWGTIFPAVITVVCVIIFAVRDLEILMRHRSDLRLKTGVETDKSPAESSS